VDEVNASFCRIQIAYCCLLVFIPGVTGLLVGGLVKCLGFLTPSRAKVNRERSDRVRPQRGHRE
jgi:hypothetical protein